MSALAAPVVFETPIEASHVPAHGRGPDRRGMPSHWEKRAATRRLIEDCRHIGPRADALAAALEALLRR